LDIVIWNFKIENTNLLMQNPKGKLIPIGGAEDKGTDLELGVVERNNLNFFELGILKRFVKEVGRLDARIEVVTTASSIPVEVGENYLSALTKIGCTNVGILDVRERKQAMDPATVQRLKDCDAIMFSGGNQLRLTAIYGGTDFLDILKKRYQNENFVIAGTSAGAMAMSSTMIYQGNAERAHLKGEVKITTGLAFIDGVIIDSHFNKRGRFARLAQAVAANPSCLGIGLSEDTGVIITNGTQFETIGSGAVFLFDGRKIEQSNIADIEEGSPFSVQNLVVHIMENSNRYDLNTHSFEMDSHYKINP
jgi:cyanophycinase